MSVGPATSGTPVRAAAGTVLFRPGDACRGLLLVDEGAIRVQTVSETGRQVTLYRVRPDVACVLSTQCLMTGGVYPAEGIAETDVAGRFVAAGDVDRLVASDPGFRRWLFEAYGTRLSELVLLVEDLLSTSVHRKLARFLHDRESVSMTHQDIAAEIGSAREVVSRHLKDLERQGVVALGRGVVTVRDPAALRRWIDAV